MTENEPALSGELRLRYDICAMLRTVLVTFVVVSGLTWLWLIAIDRIFELGAGFSAPWTPHIAIWSAVIAGVGGIGVVRLMLFLRQPRGARITWDRDEITLWDGRDQSVTIPWSRARINRNALVTIGRRGLKALLAGKICQISDDAGSIIDVSQGTQPIWMNGRRNSADFSPLAPYFTDLPKIDLIRGAEFWVMLKWLAAIGAYFFLALGLGRFYLNDVDSIHTELDGALLVLVGSGFLFLRSLWPLFSGLRAGGDTVSKRAWRRGNLVEFGLRLLLAVAATLPALGIKDLYEVRFEMVTSGYWKPRMCVVTADGARLRQDFTGEMIWISSGGEIKRHELDGNNNAYAMAIDPGERLAAFPGPIRNVVIWNRRTGQVINSIENHGAYISTMVFSPAGDRLVTASKDKTLKVWDSQSAALLHTMEPHAGHVRSVAISSNGKLVASGCFEQVHLWNMETGQKLRIMTGFGDLVTALAFADDDRRLAVGDYSGGLSLVDVAEGKKILDLESHDSSITALRLISGGRRMISASSDQTIRFHKVSTGETVGEINLRTNKRIKKSNDYVTVLHEPRGASFKAVTTNCAVLRVDLPLEKFGGIPGF